MKNLCNKDCYNSNENKNITLDKQVNENKVVQAEDIFLDNIMVNRYGCPEDIGNLAVFFASDESEYVTGQIINVDGGMNSHVSTVAQMRALNKRTW